MAAKKQGLYANIHAKQERIAHGSGEHMKKAGEKGRPSAKAFEQSEKTAKHPAKKSSASKGSSAKSKSSRSK